METIGLALATGPTEDMAAFVQDEAYSYIGLSGNAKSHNSTTIGRLAKAAMRRYEGDTGRQLSKSTWRWTVRNADGELRIPKPPLQSVELVECRIGGGYEPIDPTQYEVIADDEPARIIPAGGRWPGSQLRITFVCGAVSWFAMQDIDHQAVLMLVNHWFVNREAVTVGAAGAELPHGYNAIVDCRSVRGFAR